jgi:hypothetical protein
VDYHVPLAEPMDAAYPWQLPINICDSRESSENSVDYRNREPYSILDNQSVSQRPGVLSSLASCVHQVKLIEYLAGQRGWRVPSMTRQDAFRHTGVTKNTRAIVLAGDVSQS